MYVMLDFQIFFFSFFFLNRSFDFPDFFILFKGNLPDDAEIAL